MADVPQLITVMSSMVPFCGLVSVRKKVPCWMSFIQHSTVDCPFFKTVRFKMVYLEVVSLIAKVVLICIHLYEMSRKRE